MGSSGGGMMPWCCNFLLLVVLLCCVAMDAATDDAVVTTCRGVKPIFEAKNISADIPDEPVSGANLTTCEAGASCCTGEMEAALRLLVRKDFQALLHHNSRSLEGLLASTAANLQELVLEAARRSRNKTLALFSDVYPRLAGGARQSISQLFADVLAYLDVRASSTSPSSSSQDLDLERSATDFFFARLFPEVYRHALTPGRRGQFAADYAACLRASAPALQPFGDVPRLSARNLRRSSEAARTLLQALDLGAEVLASTDSLLMSEPGADHCHAALLRMSYCSRCRGLTRRTKPCAGYCLNVMRGCLTQHAAELDLPWSGFVEATERLVAAVKAVDLDALQVVAALPNTISDAIMLAMEDGPALEKKVKQTCGPPRWAPEEESVEGARPPGDDALAGGVFSTGQILTGEAGDEASLSSRLHIFVASLSKSRGFYANLAESLCSDDSFAETRDTADCWNGQRIGAVVASCVDNTPQSKQAAVPVDKSVSASSCPAATTVHAVQPEGNIEAKEGGRKFATEVEQSRGALRDSCNSDLSRSVANSGRQCLLMPVSNMRAKSYAEKGFVDSRLHSGVSENMVNISSQSPGNQSRLFVDTSDFFTMVMSPCLLSPSERLRYLSLSPLPTEGSGMIHRAVSPTPQYSNDSVGVETLGATMGTSLEVNAAGRTSCSSKSLETALQSSNMINACNARPPSIVSCCNSLETINEESLKQLLYGSSTS